MNNAPVAQLADAGRTKLTREGGEMKREEIIRRADLEVALMRIDHLEESVTEYSEKLRREDPDMADPETAKALKLNGLTLQIADASRRKAEALYAADQDKPKTISGRIAAMLGFGGPRP